MDIVDDARIPATQKLRLLNDWESEVRGAMTASEDLLPGPLTAELHEVLAAKAELLRQAQ